MRIAVITDSIDDGSAGVGTYARGLAGQLKAESRHEFTFVHRTPHNFYEGAREMIYPGFGHRLLRKQVMMARALDAAGFDLVHETFHFPPFWGHSRFLKVMTIHDVTPFLFGTETMKLSHWLSHRLLLPPLARRADHILTDSHHSRLDIVRVLGVSAERVSVARLGVDRSFYRRSAAEIERVRREYALPKRFLLFVGTIEPRKNLARLVDAFGRAGRGMEDVALVIAGGLGWKYEPLLRAVADSPEHHRILLPGRIDQDDLPALYSAAVALVYPSLYEGFGLPPLEAMACGCPVITSNVSSLPEVTGDAAVAVDPHDTDALAEAMTQVVGSEALRYELREKGSGQAALFSWEACAQETMGAYDNLSLARQRTPGAPFRLDRRQVP